MIEGIQQRSFALTEPTQVVGVVQGSVRVPGGVTLTVSGAIQGSVHIAPDARLEVDPSGRVQGALHVAVNGVASIRGQFAGSIHSDGHVIFRSGATQAGPIYGPGTVDFEPNVTVVEPRIEDGAQHYDL